MAKLKAEVEEVVKITPEQIKIIEKTIETQLAVNGVTDQQITKWEEEFKSLKINGIEDKEGYEKVYESRQKAKKTRILIKEVCVAGRAPLIAETKEWISRQNSYTARMESIEEYLQGEESKVDAEKERIKQDKIRLQTERLKGRVAIIQGFGAMWDGSHYTLDEVSYSQDILRETEDDFFNNKIVPQYKAIYEAKEKIRIANKEAQDLLEAQQRKIAEDLKQQQEELARQQDELKKENEALELKKKEQQASIERENAKAEQEKKQAHAAKCEKRSKQLIDAGLTYEWNRRFFLREVVVTLQEVENEPDDKWDIILDDVKSNVAIVKAKIKEEADAEQERLNKIAIENATAERERLAEEQRKKEREELEEGNDLDRWLFFLKSLPKEYPEMSSRQYRTMIDTAKKSIEDIKLMKATRK